MQVYQQLHDGECRIILNEASRFFMDKNIVEIILKEYLQVPIENYMLIREFKKAQRRTKKKLKRGFFYLDSEIYDANSPELYFMDYHSLSDLIEYNFGEKAQIEEKQIKEQKQILTFMTSMVCIAQPELLNNIKPEKIQNMIDNTAVKIVNQPIGYCFDPRVEYVNFFGNLLVSHFEVNKNK